MSEEKYMNEANAELPADQAEADDPIALRQKKRRRNRIIGAAVLAVVIIAVAALQLLGNDAAKRQSGAAIDEQVISGAVESGNITKTLSAYGTLASANEEDVSVPGKIRVTNYHVSTGDTVKKGDKIATVDRNTVLAAIADIQDLIDQLDAKVEELKDSSESSTVSATADGTVVKVYAKAGDAVTDVMYDHGALMLVSLDGLYALKVDNTGNLRVGESVTVAGSDGTEREGQVAAIEKDTVTITVPLSGFSFDGKVTARTSSGATLGSGNLFVYSQQKITGYSGTVSSVSVSEGTSVSSGDTLLSLSDTDYTADSQVLLKQRKKLVDQSNRLTQISKTGYVCAEEDGVVSNLNEDVLESGDVVTTTKAVSAKNSTTSEKKTEKKKKSEKKGEVTTQDDGGTEKEATKNDTTKTGQTEHNDSKITITASVIWLDSDGSGLSEGLPDSVEVSISPNDESKPANQGNGWLVTFEKDEYDAENKPIEYKIDVSGVPDGFSSSSSSSGKVVRIYLKKNAPKPSEDESSSSVSASSSGAASSQASGGTQPTTNTSSESSSKNSAGTSSKSSAASSKGSMSSGAAGKMPSGGAGGASFGGASGSGLVTEEGATIEDAEAEQENPYAYEETVLCELMPNDEVSVDISIDELDIGRIVVGEDVRVTLDALPGQSFDGKISALNPFGKNSGGSTKYTVTVTMSKQESMLLGMSASVGIKLEDRANVLLVPEAALVEQDGKTYINTTYDEAKDELGGLVEVETGIADGTNVEVTSGLEANQPYYYRYAGTVSYVFANS